MKIDSQRRLVILPKVCSWFPSDFSIKRNNFAATPIDCLWVIAPYLKADSRATLIRLLSDGTNPSVRFKNYNFRCQVLSQFGATIASSPVLSSAIPTQTHAPSLTLPAAADSAAVSLSGTASDSDD